MQTWSSAGAHEGKNHRLLVVVSAAIVALALVIGAGLFRATPERQGGSGSPAELSRARPVQMMPGAPASSDLVGEIVTGTNAGQAPVVRGAPQPLQIPAATATVGVALAVALAAGALLGVYLSGRRRGRAEVAALQAEMARREAAERERIGKEVLYRAHFNNMSDSVFVMKVEDDGRFTTADRNLAHLASFGGSDFDPIGKELHEFMPAEEAEFLTSFYRQCVEAGAPVRYVVFWGLDQQPKHWETVLAPVYDENGKITHVIGTSRDISDRVELEERLRQSQKMEAMGQLTGGIAHDFNNLLTVMMGNLDLLKRAREIQRPKLIDNALQAVERARELTQKLLAFGRRQPLKPEPTDLKALIAGMDDMLMQSLRGDVRLELELPDDLWPVEVDQAQLQVALINLAANARDAMPRGGTLRIEAENTLLREGEPFEGVAVSVTDTGHGMPREVLDRAFDPFFTTKDEGKGTGLGLAQVYGFAVQSGGSAEIRSEVDRGTTVILYLPRCHSSVVAGAAASADVAIGDRSLRVLLVEDNIQVAEVASSILKENGHEVTVAHSADEALRQLETGGQFDLVFSDLVMPGERSGLDLARIVRGRWSFLPILLATGYSEAGGRATQEGFPLLTKPYRAATLVATIERIAAESTAALLRRDGS